METNKYLFRSQLNDTIILAFLFATLFGIWGFHYPPLSIPVWLLILVGALFNYILLALFQSRYFFYEDRIVRVFIFRPFCRKTVFMYEQIFKVKFTRDRYPVFVVYRKNNQFLPVTTVTLIIKRRI